MSKKQKIKEEATDLHGEGSSLALSFQRKKDSNFSYDYQRWYTKALSVVAALAPDRLPEFRGYYEIDPKRKALTHGTYVIQDFLKSVAPAGFAYSDFDTRERALICFFNQLTIFKAIIDRADSVLGDIEGSLFAELEDDQIIVARELAKISLRAAGALMGVVLEGHLDKVATTHKVKISKKNPTIADLNEPLKAAGVIDLPTWRKISFLADLRNICSHKKDVEPTKVQVEDLIQGTEWVTKNVF